MFCCFHKGWKDKIQSINGWMLFWDEDREQIPWTGLKKEQSNEQFCWLELAFMIFGE